MASINNLYDNGSMRISPKLYRDKFYIWKNLIEAFLINVDSNMLDIIIDGPHIPMILITSSSDKESISATKERYINKEKDL